MTDHKKEALPQTPPAAAPQGDTATRVLSLISHKLKTPLSIINGYSEAILSQTKQGELSDFVYKALLDINKQGEKASLLVDRLVRFTMVDNMPKTGLKREQINLASLLGAVSDKCILRDDSLNVMSSDNTIRVQGPAVEVKCDTPVKITGDKALLSIALEELVDNSIKFNNNSPKKLRLFYSDEDGQDDVSVADNGVGIKPEHISKIFDKFYQVDDFFTGQVEGWGLGLAMLKRIVGLHGGKILVRSQYGVGTIITLRLPKGDA